MRKFLLSLLIVLPGLLLCLQAPIAAPKKDFISKSEHDALWTAHPELKAAEDEMRRVYTETRTIVGEEGGGGQWLGIEQGRWERVHEQLALSEGDLGSPELVQYLIDSTRKRIPQLREIAADGRIVERQLFKQTSGVELHMEIRRFEGDKAQVNIVSFTEGDGYNECTFRSRLARNADGTWSFTVSDFGNAVVGVTNNPDGYAATMKKDNLVDCVFGTKEILSPEQATLPDAAALQAMGIKITTDAEAYNATVEIASTADRPKGIDSFSGMLRRTNKAVRLDDPTLEEVAVCTLGADHSQKVRVLRNDKFYDYFVYYLETSQGLIPLDSFADKALRGTFDEIERSTGSSMSLGCNGDKKERVLTISGEFTSNYRHIHVIRYNSARAEWQVLRTAERARPTDAYLGKNDMKVVIPKDRPSELLVYTVNNQKTERVEQNKMPSAKGYHAIRIKEDDLVVIPDPIP